MAHTYLVYTEGSSPEPYSNQSDAKLRAEGLIKQGRQAYIEMYLDTGIISGASLVKYEYWDQEHGCWVIGDSVPGQET